MPTCVGAVGNTGQTPNETASHARAQRPERPRAWLGASRLTDLLARAPLFSTEQPTRRSFLTTATMLWLPSVFWLAALRPGLMSPDSIDQWHQAVHGHWVDSHPPAYTALLWISYRLSGSPFLIAMVQTATIALALTALGFAVRRLGASRRAVALLSAVLVLSPMVGMFGVTIWKDVPYTALFLLIVATTCVMVRSALDDRRDDCNRRLLQLSGLTCGLVALRQNGVILAIVLLSMTVVALKPGWRRSACVFALPLLTLGGLKLVVYPLSGIKASTVRNEVGGLIHDIAAVQKADPSVFSVSDRATMERLAPVSEWARLYDTTGCSTTDWQFQLPDDDRALDGQFGAVVRVWLHAVRSKPAVVVRNHACLSAVAWNPVIVGASPTVPDGVVSNDDGLRVEPVNDELRNVALSLRSRTKQSALRVAVLWRSVPWIYLAYVTLALLARRTRSRVVLLTAAPLVALQVSVGLVTPAQDARYMFAGLPAAVLLLSLAAVGESRLRSCP